METTTRKDQSQDAGWKRAAWLLAILAMAGLLSGCGGGGSSGSAGAPGDNGVQGPPGGGGVSDTLNEDEDLPGVNVGLLAVVVAADGELPEEEGVAAAIDPDINFSVGDRVQITFSLTTDDDRELLLSDFDSGSSYISGPSTNYQRVVARAQDVLTNYVDNGDGTYTYTFAPLPATYLAPYNDTASFDEDDGEMQGDPLVAGTYTLGIELRRDYNVAGTTVRDVGNITHDFLFGGSAVLNHREVVKLDNCNRCHNELQFHGGMRRDPALCVLCHTSGAEDKNTDGATPDVSVDFRVMIHKIHNAGHLPSVNGVATNPDGTRNYAAAPQPYELTGYSGVPEDFSAVLFPAWPNLQYAMPRDQGYTALAAGQKAQEDQINKGVTACYLCHGDPDDDGPLTAPEQGDLIYAQPSRRACGSCHDDIDWSHSYTSNGQTMPAQDDDSACILCHGPDDGSLSVEEAHLHPMLDPAVVAGVNIVNLAVSEAGTHNSDGTIDPGEKVQVSFEVENDAGTALDPSTALSSDFSFVISGPLSNRNIVVYTSFPRTAVPGTGVHTINLCEIMEYEFLGDATGGADVLTASRTPFWDSLGRATTVYERTATTTTTALSAAAPIWQNFIDVDDSTGFTDDNFIVIDDGVAGKEEYKKIAKVVGNRIYFLSPNSYALRSGLYKSHDDGASVKKVTLTTRTVTTHYTRNEALGQITLIPAMGIWTAGNAVVVTYTSDFVMPTVYPNALNATQELDETWGRWEGKSIVSGTYDVGLFTRATVNLTLYGETQSYSDTVRDGIVQVLVGSATELEEYDTIDTANNCYACHTGIWFHGGGRRDFTTCILCHTTAGAEDRAWWQYDGQETPYTLVEFRQMLHRIHRGAELTNASTYAVIGNSNSVNQYDEVEFPAMPDGVKNCRKCHGESDAWLDPADRDHPTEQGDPVREWRTVCTSCHDSDEAAAHVDINTSPAGVESCAICHGEGRAEAVELKHKTR